MGTNNIDAGVESEITKTINLKGISEEQEAVSRSFSINRTPRSPGVVSRLMADTKRRRSIRPEEPVSPKKRSTGQVFERLIHDTNRRYDTRDKLEDYRLEKEKEEEEFFKTESPTKSDAVFRRLEEDTKARRYTVQLTSSQPSFSKTDSISRKKTMEMTMRLSESKKNTFLLREQAKQEIEDVLVREFQEIIEAKHPKKELDLDTFNRLTYVQPKSKCETKVKRKMTRAQTDKLVHRLYNWSPKKAKDNGDSSASIWNHSTTKGNSNELNLDESEDNRESQFSNKSLYR